MGMSDEEFFGTAPADKPFRIDIIGGGNSKPEEAPPKLALKTLSDAEFFGEAYEPSMLEKAGKFAKDVTGGATVGSVVKNAAMDFAHLTEMLTGAVGVVAGLPAYWAVNTYALAKGEKPEIAAQAAELAAGSVLPEAMTSPFSTLAKALGPEAEKAYARSPMGMFNQWFGEGVDEGAKKLAEKTDHVLPAEQIAAIANQVMSLAGTHAVRAGVYKAIDNRTAGLDPRQSAFTHEAAFQGAEEFKGSPMAPPAEDAPAARATPEAVEVTTPKQVKAIFDAAKKNRGSPEEMTAHEAQQVEDLFARARARRPDPERTPRSGGLDNGPPTLIGIPGAENPISPTLETALTKLSKGEAPTLSAAEKLALDDVRKNSPLVDAEGKPLRRDAGAIDPKLLAVLGALSATAVLTAPGIYSILKYFKDKETDRKQKYEEELFDRRQPIDTEDEEGRPLFERGFIPPKKGEKGRVMGMLEDAAPLALAAGAFGAVKGKGGMWHPSAIERLIEPLAARLTNDRINFPEEGQPVTPAQKASAWSERAIRNYLNKHAGTEGDPLKDVQVPFKEGTNAWGELVDSSVHSYKAGSWPKEVREKLGLDKAPDEEPIWNFQNVKPAEREALTNHLSHVGDYLRENVVGPFDADVWIEKTPEGKAYRNKHGRPPNENAAAADYWSKVQESPEYQAHLENPNKLLEQYDLVRAVKETARWDAEMAKKMEKAEKEATDSLPVYKDYGDGFKWVEVRSKGPAELPKDNPVVKGEGGKYYPKDIPVPKDGYATPEEARAAGLEALARKETEKALQHEGDSMGHCVGGYCDYVESGDSKIYSLRDAKGKSHVTVEVRPAGQNRPRQFGSLKDIITGHDQDIVQIKGKQNRAPVAAYLPYVQDFVKGGKWGEVGDLSNAGLLPHIQKGGSSTPYTYKPAGPRPDEIGLPSGYYTKAELHEAYTKAGAELDERLNSRQELEEARAAEAKFKGGKQAGSVDPKLLAGIVAAGGATLYFSEHPEKWKELTENGLLGGLALGVTKGGKSLVTLFHGTTALPFRRFREGSFLTKDPEFAKVYSEWRRETDPAGPARVILAKAAIENMATPADVWKVAEPILKKNGIKEEWLPEYKERPLFELIDLNAGEHHPRVPAEIVKALKEKGFRGVEMEDYAPEMMGPGPNEAPTYVMFYPEDVRIRKQDVQVEYGKGLINKQRGSVDPKLLLSLAAVSAGAALGATLSDNKLLGAIIGGVGAGAAAKLSPGRAAQAVRTAFEGDKRIRINQFSDVHDHGIAAAARAIWQQQQKIVEGAPKEAERVAITHALQQNKVGTLPPALQRAAKKAGEFFAAVGEQGKSAGVLRDLIDNYVTNLWDLTGKNKDVWEQIMNRAGGPSMSPESRFSLRRSISSIEEGKRLGLTPVTEDVAQIMGIYGNSLARSIENKKMIQSLREATVPGSEQRLLQSSQKAPPSYVTIDHPQLNGVRVHPDIAPSMRFIFENSDPGVVARGLEGVNTAIKRSAVSFSLFHAKALADAAIGAASNPLTAGKNIITSALGTNQYLKMLKEGGAGDLVDQAQAAGLKFSFEKGKLADEDVGGSFYSAMKLAQKGLDSIIPGAGLPVAAVTKINHLVDTFMWERLHAGLKLATFAEKLEVLGNANAKAAAKGKATLKTREELAAEAASFTNDIYGGLNWRRLAEEAHTKWGRDIALAAYSRGGRRTMQLLMFAPDWTLSTTRAATRAFGKLAGYTEGTGLKGLLEPQNATDLHRQYMMRSALYYAVVGDGINYALSGHHLWDNKDPTMVDMGDGRTMQWSKHSMEPIHWLTKPGQQGLNKLGFFPKEALNQLLGTEYLSASGHAPRLDTSLPGRLGHAARSMTPIAAQQAFGGQATQGSGVAGFLGAPIYGRTNEERRLRKEQLKREARMKKRMKAGEKQR